MNQFIKYLETKEFFSLYRQSNRKERVGLLLTIGTIILVFGGVFGGLLAGTRNAAGNGTIPNPYVFIFGTIGFALAGFTVIKICWESRSWPQLGIGATIFVVGLTATFVEVNIIIPFSFLFSTGIRKLDEFLYSLLLFVLLCLILEIVIRTKNAK